MGRLAHSAEVPHTRKQGRVGGTRCCDSVREFGALFTNTGDDVNCTPMDARDTSELCSRGDIVSFVGYNEEVGRGHARHFRQAPADCCSLAGEVDREGGFTACDIDSHDHTSSPGLKPDRITCACLADYRR